MGSSNAFPLPPLHSPLSPLYFSPSSLSSLSLLFTAKRSMKTGFQQEAATGRGSGNGSGKGTHLTTAEDKCLPQRRAGHEREPRGTGGEQWTLAKGRLSGHCLPEAQSRTLSTLRFTAIQLKEEMETDGAALLSPGCVQNGSPQASTASLEKVIMKTMLVLCQTQRESLKTQGS